MFTKWERGKDSITKKKVSITAPSNVVCGTKPLQGRHTLGPHIYPRIFFDNKNKKTPHNHSQTRADQLKGQGRVKTSIVRLLVSSSNVFDGLGRTFVMKGNSK